MSRTRKGSKGPGHDDWYGRPLRGWLSVKHLGKIQSRGEERRRDCELVRLEVEQDTKDKIEEEREERLAAAEVRHAERLRYLGLSDGVTS